MYVLLGQLYPLCSLCFLNNDSGLAIFWGGCKRWQKTLKSVSQSRPAPAAEWKFPATAASFDAE